MSDEAKELQSVSRRNFLELVGKGSFTAAMVAGAAVLSSSEAVAQTAVEERKREKEAVHVMTVATAYVLGASRSYPILVGSQRECSKLHQRQNLLKLAPGGQLGAGGLCPKSSNGTIQAAQHSLSNFAPFASAVDLINMPYFCGSNQRFTNLVTSNAWKSEVHPKVEASGFKALFYIVIDPRVVAIRKGGPGP